MSEESLPSINFLSVQQLIEQDSKALERTVHLNMLQHCASVCLSSSGFNSGSLSFAEKNCTEKCLLNITENYLLHNLK